MSLHGRVKQLMLILFWIITIPLRFLLLLSHIRDLDAFREGIKDGWEQAAKHTDLSADKLRNRVIALQQDVLRLMRAVPFCPDDT